MQVVTQHDVLNFVERAGAHLAEAFARGGQLSIFGVLRRGDLDATHALHSTTRQQPQPIDPENFGQGRGVAAVGLLLRSFFRLDQHGLLAVVLVQHFQ